MVRLKLFGDIAWQFDATCVPVRGKTRTGVLVLLAERHGMTVSVDTLLDALWHDPPSSGANAVQRHVCALRGQLERAGFPHPESIIESVPGGYRLASTVDTDDRLLQEQLADRENPQNVVEWWSGALPGSHSLVHAGFRVHLESLAAAALAQWVDSDAVPDPPRVERRASAMLRHTPYDRTVLRIHGRAVRTRRCGQEHVSPAGAVLLRDCLGLWSDDRSGEALDRLDAASDLLGDDLFDRVTRWVIWLRPDDRWARSTLSLAVEESVSNTEQFGRIVATLDGRCFEEMDAGRELARTHVRNATDPVTSARALRAQYLLGLSAPHNSAQDTVVALLESIGIPSAAVEASRFRFLSLLRIGRLDEAEQQLEKYECVVDEMWPRAGDDFAPMARAALRRSVDPSASDQFGEPQPRLASGFVADPRLLSTVTCIRRLVMNTPAEPPSDFDFYRGISGLAPSPTAAAHLLRDMNSGQPVAHRALAMAADLESITREKQFVLVPIALCLVAEALAHCDIAAAAHQALEPWSGQMLGMWPMDFYFGPANDWIARLEAV